MRVVLIACLLACIGACSAQQPPAMPSGFTAIVSMTLSSCVSGGCTNTTLYAHAEQDTSIPAFLWLFTSKDVAHVTSIDLQRCDMGKEYVVDLATRNCTVKPIAQKTVDMFAFVPLSSYSGTQEVNSQKCDSWTYNNGAVQMSLFTLTGAPSVTPVRLLSKSSDQVQQIDFMQWDATTPDSGDFAVLPMCPTGL